MKLTSRQLLLSALKPLLFCVGMYCVVLVSSVFVCSSLYHAFKGGKKVEVVETTTTASLPAIKSTDKNTAVNQ